MAKRSILVFLIVLFLQMYLITLVSCNMYENKSFETKNNSIFLLWIYPQGTLNESYKFELLNNNILQISVGKREIDSPLDPHELIQVSNQTKVDLSNEDVDSIMNIVSQIYNDKSIKTDTTYCTDIWYVKYSYKDKSIYQPCYDDTSKELEQLYEELIKLSPIKINMHGFA